MRNALRQFITGSEPPTQHELRFAAAVALVFVAMLLVVLGVEAGAEAEPVHLPASHRATAEHV